MWRTNEITGWTCRHSHWVRKIERGLEGGGRVEREMVSRKEKVNPSRH